MSVDILVGVLVKNNNQARSMCLFYFDPTDPNGSDPDSFAGFPLRKCSTLEFRCWLNQDPAAQAFYQKVRKHPHNHTPEVSPITDELIDLAWRLRTNGKSTDTARWLQYWLCLARQRWGSRAAIMFCS